MAAVHVEHLCKTYLSHKKAPGLGGAVRSLFVREKVEVLAVRDVGFDVAQGELVGFLGPNGAGKTTTLKMLTGILQPTSGEVEVLGHVPMRREPEMLRQISLVMGNKMQLWWDLPAWDSFRVLKELYEVEDAVFDRRLAFLVEALEIGDKLHTQVRKLSLGERMKCELVAALLHGPRVVFLDEPTIGLDVVSQKRIRDFLKQLHREDGSTILLTSHYMQDVQELCERVIVIDHGKLAFDGTLASLTARFSDRRRLRLLFEHEVEASDLDRFGKVIEHEGATATLEVSRKDTPRITASILQSMRVADVGIEEVAIEDVVRQLFAEGRVGGGNPGTGDGNRESVAE
ncbi:MAG: ATP-binding cassette domain-containing protein [Fimbriimonadaceae bacterium]|nr:ATP-binding cassette domain-containing protein [Fimbriimonadaceae bacterium]